MFNNHDEKIRVKIPEKAPKESAQISAVQITMTQPPSPHVWSARWNMINIDAGQELESASTAGKSRARAR